MAEKYINNAIELDKELSAAHHILGYIYFIKKDYPKALKNYLKVLELEKEKIQTEDAYYRKILKTKFEILNSKVEGLFRI